MVFLRQRQARTSALGELPGLAGLAENQQRGRTPATSGAKPDGLWSIDETEDTEAVECDPIRRMLFDAGACDGYVYRRPDSCLCFDPRAQSNAGPQKIMARNRIGDDALLDDRDV